MSEYYVLDGHEPRAIDDRREWAEWMQMHKDSPRGDDAEGVDDCRVGSTHIGEVWVSTTFLGLNHAFHGGPPVLFETMVFGGPLDQEQERYATWDAAERGHEEMVARVREASR